MNCTRYWWDGEQMKDEYIFSCHDCHHLSSTEVCEHCGSERTGIGSETLKIGRRVAADASPALMDVISLTTEQRVGFRLMRGFALLKQDGEL